MGISKLIKWKIKFKKQRLLTWNAIVDHSDVW